MKKWRNYLSLAILLFLITIAGVAVWKKSGVWDGKEDLKIGVIADNGIGIISVSPQRRMINVFKVGDETQVWIPKGLGWYQADKVKKILSDEKKMDMIPEIFFFNFGFIPDKINILANTDDWNGNKTMINNEGLGTFIKYKWMAGSMIINSNEAKHNLDEEKGLLSEVMPRDFADSAQANEDIKWSIYNTTNKSGFADFIGTRLEWTGGAVLGAENSQEPIQKPCLIKFNSEDKEITNNFGEIKQILGCETERDETLYGNEAELYLGENLAEVLKYLSYVRSQ